MNKAPRHAQRGVTLIEVMVSITVGLILLSGVISIFISNKTGYRLQESSNVLDENARFALSQLQYDLRMADHWGGIERDQITIDAALDAPVGTPCSFANAISTNGFVGIEGKATTPLSDCIPASDYQPNTDILIIRYAGPDRVASGYVKGTGGQSIYLRTGIGRRGVIFKGAKLTTSSSVPSDLYDSTNEDPPQIANYAYHTVIYFIRKCASQDRGTAGACDASDDTTPTLCRLVLNGQSMVQEDVVAGVEQLQVLYGALYMDKLVNGKPTIQYDDATALQTGNKWDRVVNLQLSLMIRGSEFDVAYQDPAARDSTKAYQLAGKSGDGAAKFQPATESEHFHRKRYDFSVQIRNMTRA